jgi:hypothetical protein
LRATAGSACILSRVTSTPLKQAGNSFAAKNIFYFACAF